MLYSLAFAGAAVCHAQSQPTQNQAQNQAQTQDQVQAQNDTRVAEAARQERARKQNQQKKSRHIYTADDLKRDQILTREDRAQLEARKYQLAAPPSTKQKPPDAPVDRPPVLAPPPAVASPRELAPVPPEPRALPVPRPAPVAPPSSKLIPGKLMLVTVRPGDSLWKFAAACLGDGHRWQELLAFNPGLPNPNLLEVGSQIVVPAPVAPL